MSKRSEVRNHKRYPRSVISQFSWIMNILRYEILGKIWQKIYVGSILRKVEMSAKQFKLFLLGIKEPLSFQAGN